MNIDEILADDKKVQTFANAKQKEVESTGKNAVGRPAKPDSEKTDRKVLYFKKKDLEKIAKIAKLYDMRENQYLKMIILKELRRETLDCE